jgi:hypothetical protein
MRKVALIIVPIIIAAVGVGVWKQRGTTKNPETKEVTAQVKQPEVETPKTIRLLATGDFIAHDSVNSAAK